MQWPSLIKDRILDMFRSIHYSWDRLLGACPYSFLDEEIYVWKALWATRPAARARPFCPLGDRAKQPVLDIKFASELCVLNPSLPDHRELLVPERLRCRGVRRVGFAHGVSPELV